MSFKKILVTGGAGFIGSHLTTTLLDLGWNVSVLDNLSSNTSLTTSLLTCTEFIQGDVRDKSVVMQAAEGCSVIIHLAAVVGVDEVIKRNIETIETETVGTSNVVRAAIEHNIKKIIYASSSAVYDEVQGHSSKEEDKLAPESSYSIAKRLNEEYLESVATHYGIATNSLRFFNVYGENQDLRMVIPRFFEQALTGKPIQVFGNGMQTRDFTHVSEVVKAIGKLAFKKDLSGIYNISRGIEISILELAKLVKKICHSNSPIELMDFPEERLSFKVDRRVGCADKLFDHTGFKPEILLENGLQQYLESLREPLRRAI